MRCFVRAAIGALAFATVAAGSALAQSGVKIAYINSQQILAQAPGWAAAEAQLKKEADGLRAQAQSMQDSLNNMVQAYTKVQSTLSDSVQAVRESAIRAKQSDYAKRTQALQQQAQQRENELIGPIMQQIDSVIETIRSENGYALVFDAGAQGGAIVAADTSLNITSQVIARLKASTAKQPSKKPGESDQPSGIKSSRAGVKGSDGPTGRS